jgi:predicted short-subunit dehydrogenase-like oxidoreductase (DUF2520 family)
MSKVANIRSVVVVGSGNVAESVALAVADSFALELKQVVARNAVRAEAVAQLAGCEWCSDLGEAADADLYIIAVSDRAVGDVAEALRRREDSVVVHTAGSVEMDALGDGDRGVLYPFQTFTAGRRVDFSAVPLFVEGSDEDTTQAIESVANALSQRVYRANSKRRREIHLTGVFACNFVNALYSMATDLLDEREGLPFDVLRPLIEETAAKAVEAAHPRNVQTGPAVRGDKAVAERHVAMLGEANQQEIYKLLTDYIWQTSRKI